MMRDLKPYMGFIATVVFSLAAFAFVWFVNVKVDEQVQAERDRIHSCIDKGGYPVKLEVYVKGLGEGHVCVKSIETIVE